MVLVPVFSVLLIPALLLISVALMLTPLAQVFFRLVDIVLSGLWHGLETLTRLTWSQAFVGWIPLGVFGSVLIVSCICLTDKALALADIDVADAVNFFYTA